MIYLTMLSWKICSVSESYNGLSFRYSILIHHQFLLLDSFIEKHVMSQIVSMYDSVENKM